MPPPIGLRGHCTHLKYRFISLYPSLVWYLKKKYENADFIKLGFVSIWVHPRQFHDYLCQFYLEQAIKTIMFAQASIFWLETNWKLYQSFNWVITVGAKGRMAAPNRMIFWKNSKRPSPPPPHFRKMMLQFFMMDMMEYMQRGTRAR